MKFNAACIQLNSSDKIDENINAVTSLIREASAADIILLPENTFLMENPDNPSSVVYTMENHPGIAACRELARSLGKHILIGSVAVMGKNKKLNRSLLIDGKGNIAAYYDKIHLFDVELGNGERYAESARMEHGAEAALAATPWGTLGLTVCYDVRFASLYRMLAKAGASFFSVPAAFTVPTGTAHWHVLLRARAIEHGCFVFAPAQCGEHPGKRSTYGHSLIVNPWGEIIAEKPDGVGIITATIDTDEVKNARARLPSLSHDRDFTLRKF